MSLQKKLLLWFDKNQRPLPWRKHYEPYAVWVSEIMLQQTQVDTAMPYYDRWMKTFPTVKALAAAPEEKVLKAWQGLGYYSRARNIHAGAKRIASEFKGVFPSRFEDIQSLKGIGPYTAGAIASIAFNQDRPIVDGNVFRVLSRLFAISDAIDDPKSREKFWQLQESLIPKGSARYFNQGLMELGALICTKQNPKCSACPVQKFCVAFKHQNMEDYPVKNFKKTLVRVTASAIVLSHRGSFLIHERPVGKIMGGLWEFPEWKLAKEEVLTQAEIAERTLKASQKELRFSGKLKPLGVIKRNYTHHLESLHVFQAECSKNCEEVRGWKTAWAAKSDFKKYPFSSAHAKIASLLN